MIKPTVGRVVWFWPSEHFVQHRATHRVAFAFGGPGHDPCAAIVVKVWSDSIVNLAVFDINGNTHAVTSCPLVQDGETVRPGESYCEWMPYQKGQAAKTEALERKVNEVTDPLGH